MNAFQTIYCCKTENSILEEMIYEYYEAVFPCMETLLTELYAAEVFGKQDLTERIYNQINNFHYLMFLLSLIHLEMMEDAKRDLYLGTGCGIPEEIDYYVEKYNLDCIQRRFMCTDCDSGINDALEIFGLNPDFVDYDGIGFMYIDDQNANCAENFNTFRIF